MIEKKNLVAVVLANTTTTDVETVLTGPEDRVLTKAMLMVFCFTGL